MPGRGSGDLRGNSALWLQQCELHLCFMTTGGSCSCGGINSTGLQCNTEGPKSHERPGARASLLFVVGESKVGTQRWSCSPIQLQSAHTQATENYIKSSKVSLHDDICCLLIIFMINRLVCIKCHKKKNTFHEHKVTSSNSFLSKRSKDASFTIIMTKENSKSWHLGSWNHVWHFCLINRLSKSLIL